MSVKMICPTCGQPADKVTITSGTDGNASWVFEEGPTEITTFGPYELEGDGSGEPLPWYLPESDIQRALRVDRPAARRQSQAKLGIRMRHALDKLAGR